MSNLIFWTCMTTMVLFVPSIMFALMGMDDLAASGVDDRRRVQLDLAEPESELMRDFAQSLQISPDVERVRHVRAVEAQVGEAGQEPARRTA